MGKWRGSVKGGKSSIEVVLEHRQHRQRHHGLNSDESQSPVAAIRTIPCGDERMDRERAAVRRTCKVWSTADFRSLKVLGEGAYGVVHLVQRSDTGEAYALKMMKKSGFRRKNLLEGVFAEREILAEARSRWFVQLHATFQDTKYVYMVMEFLQGGDLIGHLIRRGRFTIEETRFYMAQLLEALNTVHRAGFVHRDVKPDNMVLDAKGHLKLLDFGLCKHDPYARALADHTEFVANPDPRASSSELMKLTVQSSSGEIVVVLEDINPFQMVISDVKTHIANACGVPLELQALEAKGAPIEADGRTLVQVGVTGHAATLTLIVSQEPSQPQERSVQGTPAYMAPEVWSGEGGLESDIWALGVIAFECLVGHVPFHPDRFEGSEAMRIIRQKVLRHKDTLPRQLQRADDKGFLSLEAKQFLPTVLCERRRRANVAQIRADPFFAGIDFQKLHLAEPPIVPEIRGPTDASNFDDFRAAPIPEATKGRLKDNSLVWAGYEFDKEAHELLLSDQAVGELFSNAATNAERAEAEAEVARRRYASATC